jgi:galactoside O-acetyltransferase
MSLEKQIKTGRLYYEYGHNSEEDKLYEKVIEGQRNHCKEMMFDFNNARPSDVDTKKNILKNLLADMGEEVWIEAPAHFAYGCNTHIGHHFYSNFNLVIVDDGEVFIGNYVMFGPNVTLTVTGHPIYGEYRRNGTQFSMPIHIGNDVWIGANSIVLPGVTIGNNVVIGAGSVVTHDIPDNTVAYGTPCRVVREISDYDREYYRKDMKVNLSDV